MKLSLPVFLLLWGWWLAPPADGDEAAGASESSGPADAAVETGVPDATAEPTAEPTAPDETPPVASAQTVPQALRVLDRTLPCGLRVLVARDVSLPVAAVVLALEHGSEDDPETLPGLHHALAYHLLQGNRDLPPGGITSLVQDGGGLALLATGPGQTRFESLVPVSLLDDLIRAEASRLRAPSVTEALWKDTLASARRDIPRRSAAPRVAVAAAHGVPTLAQEGRQVTRALVDLSVEAVEDALAQRARYENATLTVVGPHAPQDTLAVIEAAFADLPQRARRVPPRPVKRSSETAAVRRGNDKTFLWGIEGTPAARLEAAAWCEAINRQRRRGEEDKATRLRCTFEDDVRRPHLTLRTRGPEAPEALIGRRVARLDEKPDARLLAAQRRRVLKQLDEAHARPLALARALAGSTPSDAPSDALKHAASVRSRHVLTGRDALASTDGLPPRPASTVLRMDTAVRLVADPNAKPSARKPSRGKPPRAKPPRAKPPANDETPTP